MDWLSSIFPKKHTRIFLDYASATPVRLEVRETMEKYWSNDFYNPSAIYEEGLKVKRDIEELRKSVAKLIGAGSKDVVFTAGGTESDNLAILGAFEECRTRLKKPHILVSAIEHPAVMRAAEEVVRRGGEMSIIPVNEEGIILSDEIKSHLKSNTFMISVALANSEIGVVQPIAKIGRIIREHRKNSSYPLFHTDASSAPQYIAVNLENLQCDLMTLDGSKIYGPKGVGILAVRRGVKLRPIILGGSQERGLRAGTINAPLIAGFVKALELAATEREKESFRIERLRKYFLESVMTQLPSVIVNGPTLSRLPNILSLSFPGQLGEMLVLKLDKEGVLVSVGTACSLDERVSGSPVLRAIGKSELAESTIRVSFGKYIAEKELTRAVEIFCRALKNMVK